MLLFGVTIATMIGLGWMAVERSVERAVPAFAASTDSEAIERGRQLAIAGCSCHGNLGGPLSGGTEPLFDSLPLGTLWAPNLTPGGVLARYSDAELARATREGIDPTGRPLAIMPSHLFRTMADRDLAAIIGFLRSQPGVERDVPARRLGLLPYLLVGTRVVPTSVQPAVTGPISGPLPAAEPGYGLYVARMLSCVECHGENLSGGTPRSFGPPAGPDLLIVAHRNSFETFAHAVRNGVGSDGRPLNPRVMPWPGYSVLGDEELQAIYEFLRSAGS